MSKIDYCKRGQQQGIKVTLQEMKNFSKVMKSNYIDQFIPLPNIDEYAQKLKAVNCLHEKDEAYWENEEGSHGWCCPECGEVTQWG